MQSSTLSGNSTRSALQRACGSIFQRHLRMPDEIRWWVSATSVTCPSMTIRTCSSSSALIAWQWSIGFTDAPVTSWIRFLEKFTSGLFPFEAACGHHFSVKSVILQNHPQKLVKLTDPPKKDVLGAKQDREEEQRGAILKAPKQLLTSDLRGRVRRRRIFLLGGCVLKERTCRYACFACFLNSEIMLFRLVVAEINWVHKR